jgi:integrase
MAGQIRKRGTREDGSTRWEARYWDPLNPGQRHAKMFRTKGEAQNWLTTQHNALLTGTHIAPKQADKLYKEVVDAWRETWVDIEPKTRGGYEQILRTHLLREFGQRKVSTITTASVQSYVAKLSKGGAKPGTVRNIYAALRNSLNTAVRLRLITVNPCRGVKLPRMPREEMLFLTAEEVAKLADEITRPVNSKNPDERQKPHPSHAMYGVLVFTAAYTGLRAGELLALRRRDVDLLHNRIHVRRALKELHGAQLDAAHKGLQFGPTKNHAERTVGLPKFLRDFLEEHLKSDAVPDVSPDALVFPSPTGQPMRHNLWYRRHFKPAVTRTLPAAKHGLRFHDLRHTCASLLIAAGAHAKEIQERLGHSSITITMDRYGHLMPGLDERLTDALDAAYTAAQQPTENVTELRR